MNRSAYFYKYIVKFQLIYNNKMPFFFYFLSFFFIFLNLNFIYNLSDFGACYYK